MTPKRGKLVQISTYLSPDMATRLKELSDRTRVSQAAYFREAIEDLLKRYEESSSRAGSKPTATKGRR